MNTSTLTATEQRGTLTYWYENYTHRTHEGWFYIENGVVVMRKIGGRSRYRLCRTDLVADFTPYVKPARKQKCVNCGQQLTPAPAGSDFNWIGATDGKMTCYAGATLVNHEWVSNQDHCTAKELG